MYFQEKLWNRSNLRVPITPLRNERRKQDGSNTKDRSLNKSSTQQRLIISEEMSENYTFHEIFRTLVVSFSTSSHEVRDRNGVPSYLISSTLLK